MLVQPYLSRTQMRAAIAVVAATTLVGALLPVALRQDAKPAPSRLQVDNARLPLSFEPNAGQADPQVRYVAHSSAGTLLFTPSKVVLALSMPQDTTDGAQAQAHPPTFKSLPLNGAKGSNVSTSRRSNSLVNLQFIGANPSTTL